jgi:ADP-ribosylglycohydrolase
MIGQGRASGCLVGAALGDALAAPVEFIGDIDEIARRFPPAGPREPMGDPARVTDDTQMMLAVGEALLAAGARPTPASLEPALRRAFVAWLRDPENNRAPGTTCLNACAGLERGLPWDEATVARSKGAGANMRVQPVGLLGGLTDGARAAIAQFTAAMTHGHPTALAAADLTAHAIHDLAAGGEPTGLPGRLRAYALDNRAVYHGDWLGELWRRPGAPSPAAFIARGWDECLGALDRLDAALATPDRGGDPCRLTGAAWIAEEALATSLLVFLLTPDDPVAVVRRAAVTSGDSDTIGAIAGAFAGACHGLAAWPADWVSRIEYRDRLLALGAAWEA